MKFGSFLSIAVLAAGALAEPTPVKRDPPTAVERDLSTVTSVFAHIGDLVDQLNTDIQSFNGDGSDITSDSSSLLAAIKSGASDISSSSSLTTNEALQLQTVVQGLQKKITTAVNGLIAKKSQIVSAGLGQTIYQSLTAQKAASDSLADATVSKVPQSLQGIAKQLSSGVSTELQKGIDAYQGAPGGGGSGTAPSESSSTSASATTTSGGGGGSASYSTTASVPPNSSYTASPTTSGGGAPVGTGGYTPTSGTSSPIPTNAAPLNGVSGAVGALAVLAAAIGM